MLISCIKLEQLLAELKRPSKSLETFLIKQEELRSYLISIPQARRLQLLMASNDLGNIMHKLAAIQGTVEMMECITSCVDRSNYFNLMKIQDECGQTALHVAARNKHLSAVICMLEHLLPNDRLTLLEMKDTGRLTTFHHLLRIDTGGEWIIAHVLPRVDPAHLNTFLQMQLTSMEELEPSMIEALEAYKESLCTTTQVAPG